MEQHNINMAAVKERSMEMCNHSFIAHKRRVVDVRVIGSALEFA